MVGERREASLTSLFTVRISKYRYHLNTLSTMMLARLATTAFSRHGVVATPVRLLSSGGKSSFRPNRRPSRTYRPLDPKPSKKPKGPKEPFDVSRTIPTINMKNLKITDLSEEDDLEAFGPLAADAIRLARRHHEIEPDVETQLKMMDYFTSASGSTEDLVGERRVMALDAWDFEDREAFEAQVERLVEEERVNYLDLEPTEHVTDAQLQSKQEDENMIPPNQLAHGDWCGFF
jgi:hypothetical protein